MSLEDYREIWQSQEPPADGGPLDEEVLSEVKRRSEAYDRKLFWRDAREIGVAVPAAVFFGYVALTAGPLLAQVGAGILVVGAVIVIRKLRRARRNGDAELAGRSVAARLRSEIEKVDAQIELLENVLWWYLAPSATGATLLIVAEGGWDPWTLGLLGLLAAVCAIVWHLNRRAVRCTHRPRRQRLEGLLLRLEEGDAAGRAG